MDVATHVTRRVEIAGMQLMVVDGLFTDADVIGFPVSTDISQEYAFVRRLHPWRALVSRDVAAATGWALEAAEMLGLFKRGVRLFAAAARG